MEKQYVSFAISGNKYCLDIMDVQEVVRENKFTKMPDMPEYVEGIMNLRGIVIPVISIRKKLGLEDKQAVNTSSDANNEIAALERDLKKSLTSLKLIIVKIEGVLVGFLVDSLDRVFSIDETRIQSAEGVASQVDKNLMDGVAKIDQDVYIILNIKKLLDFDERKFISQEIID